jgi:hypothetical protein
MNNSQFTVQNSNCKNQRSRHKTATKNLTVKDSGIQRFRGSNDFFTRTHKLWNPSLSFSLQPSVLFEICCLKLFTPTANWERVTK